MTANTEPCPYDPTLTENTPKGMYHCPLCGNMVLAGATHPAWHNLDDYGVKWVLLFEGDGENTNREVD